MAGWLRRSVLIAGRDCHVVLAESAGRVDIELDAAVAPIIVDPVHSLSIADLAVMLGCEDPGDLRAALDAAGFLEPFPHSTEQLESRASIGNSIVPLAWVVSEYHAHRSVAGLVAVTATEALWTGLDEAMARLAVTLFVARLPLTPQGQVYRAIARTEELWCAGDWPSCDRLRWLRNCEFPQHPEAYDLSVRELSGTMSSTVSVMHARAGRLSVAGFPEYANIGPEDFPVAFVTAMAGEPCVTVEAFGDTPSVPTWVMGIDRDETIAAARCMSEAAEYLVSSQSISDQVVRSSAENLAGPWLSPDSVICYSPAHRERLGVGSFDPAEVQGWALGRQAGNPVWLPEGLLAAPGTAPSWWHASALSSSGVAAHVSPLAAARNAWLELVERDAFQRARACADMTGLPAIAKNSMGAEDRALFSSLAKKSTACILVLASPTGIPVVLVRADMDCGRLSIGLAAACQPDVAVRRALMEAVAQAEAGGPVAKDAQLVQSPGDHSDLYSDSVWRQKLDWLRKGNLMIDLNSMPALSGCPIPPRVAIYRYPMRGLPTHVVRAIDPLLIPITFGYDSDPDGRADLAGLWKQSGRRLDQVWDPHPLG
ncbi:MAG: ribosomal protein methylthiotransferase accessory factor [Actinomycetota bacterium]|nr:ribosomal protein methylthiotransferase accessory factor [Actinomycetota bacterium]